MKLQEFRTSKQNKYALRTLLQGHVGAVACLAAHPLGTHVACGGDFSYLSSICNTEQINIGEDGTKIWNLPSSRLLSSPSGAGERGITTAIVWITRPDDADEGVAYGTEDGYVCIWKKSRNEYIVR